MVGVRSDWVQRAQHLQNCSLIKMQVLAIGSQAGLAKMVRRSEGTSVVCASTPGVGLRSIKPWNEVRNVHGNCSPNS